MQSLGSTKAPLQTKISNIKNNNINNRNNTINTISIPIHIPRTDSNEIDLNLTDQYSLVANVFDPSKMSPPDHWKCRLEQRLKDHQLIYKNDTFFDKSFYISDNTEE